MRLYVRLEAQACDVHTGAKMKVLAPQFGHVQVGGRAAEIHWKNDSGVGVIENFTPRTTPFTPISIMTTTGGVIDPTASKIGVDCDFTAHVETQHLSCSNPILFNHSKGDVQIQLIISSTPEFTSLGPIPEYSSKVVNGLLESIYKGDSTIKTCITSLVTGLDKNKATVLLSGGKVYTPDIHVRESIEKLSDFVMNSASKITTSLGPVHHLVQSKLMGHVRDNLTVNVKEGFFIGLRALQICENMGLDIQNDTDRVVNNVLTAIQLEAVNNDYKYDCLLTGKYVSMGDSIYFDQTINCDAQHASNLKMESNMYSERKSLKTMLQNKEPLGKIESVVRNKIDCEDAGAGMVHTSKNVSAVPLVEFKTAVDIVTGFFVSDSSSDILSQSEIADRTRKVMHICQVFKDNVTVNACIGLASAANLAECKQGNVNSHEEPIQMQTLIKQDASGHSWASVHPNADDILRFVGSPVDQINCNLVYDNEFKESVRKRGVVYNKEHKDLGCIVRIVFEKDIKTGYLEGTGIALSTNCETMNQSVKFNCKTELNANAADFTFTQKMEKLNNKIMPQFMAVSLASNIHQYMICKSYNIPNTNVVTQPSAPEFYRLKIGEFNESCKEPSIALRTTLEAIEKLETTQNLTEFLREAYLGVEPGRETISAHLYVTPKDTNYEKGINLLAQSLAMRVMEPADHEEHYARMVDEINAALGTNIPTNMYEVSRENQEYPEPADLKFVGRGPIDQLNEIKISGLITGIATLNPMAHLCSIKQP